MNLDPFLRAGLTAHDLPDFEPAIVGVTDVHVYLHGEVGEESSRRGGGRVEIIDRPEKPTPFLRAIMNVLDLTAGQTRTLHRARADFFLMGNNVRLEDIVLHTDRFTLGGNGTMTLPGGGVELDLVTASPLLGRALPALDQFMKQASRELIHIRVTGPLSQPQVRAVPLRALTEELKGIFQRREGPAIQPRGS
jgi:hypothetical protein